jgi:hypothetical protein
MYYFTKKEEIRPRFLKMPDERNQQLTVRSIHIPFTKLPSKRAKLVTSFKTKYTSWEGDTTDRLNNADTIFSGFITSSSKEKHDKM